MCVLVECLTQWTVAVQVCVLVEVGISILWLPILQASQSGQLWNYLQAVSSYTAPPWCWVFLLALFWKRTTEPVSRPPPSPQYQGCTGQGLALPSVSVSGTQGRAWHCPLCQYQVHRAGPGIALCISIRYTGQGLALPSVSVSGTQGRAWHCPLCQYQVHRAEPGIVLCVSIRYTGQSLASMSVSVL